MKIHQDSKAPTLKDINERLSSHPVNNEKSSQIPTWLLMMKWQQSSLLDRDVNMGYDKTHNLLLFAILIFIIEMPGTNLILIRTGKRTYLSLHYSLMEDAQKLGSNTEKG